jgi:mannonate dehydratase
VDQSYVERLHNLADGMQTGFKLMLLAFERTHDAHGRPQPELTAFHVPNAYARDVARANPAYFEWCHRPAHWSQLMIGTMEPPCDRHIGATP